MTQFVFTFSVGGAPHRFVISAECADHAEAAFLEMKQTLSFAGREDEPQPACNGQPVPH